ncbi:hypothetical protein IKZ40_06350, partial [bacterium]|nr:hypothetical protein [bacterium]
PDGVAVEKVEGAQLDPVFLLDEKGFAVKLSWQDHKDLNYSICTVTVDLDDMAVPEGGIIAALIGGALLYFFRRAKI